MVPAWPGRRATRRWLVIDWSKYCHGVVSVDPGAQTCVVEPGIVLDELNSALTPHGLMFGPRPATHDHCTLGGMLGNNSCGATAQAYGKTVDNVLRLEVLTYDGERFWAGPTSDEEYAAIVAAGGRRAEIYRTLRELSAAYADQIRERYPQIPRRVSGYNLDSLLPEHGFDVARALVGSESTLVTILHAELRLVPAPAAQALVVLGYPDIASAADAVPRIAPHQPQQLEGLDDRLIRFERERRMNPEALRLLPDGNAWLMVIFAGDTQEEADARARALTEDLHGTGHEPAVKFYDDPEHEKELADVREVALGATARVPDMPDTWEGWEDSAVPPERLGDYLRDLSKLYGQFGYSGAALYGHFGQGCVHTRIPFDLVTADGIATFRRFIERAADLVVSYGGSFSGEHGDGQSRGELLPKMFGDDLVRAFGQFKAIFDPGNRMNPGKVVAPYRIDENLRLGTSWAPRNYDTHFRYPDDDGRFDRAVMRCGGRRQVPPQRWRGDVPVLHGHPRGRALHPGPEPAAVRDAERTRRLAGHRGLAVHRGPRRPRPVPGLQGLQEGLPRRGRHGHHEGRVPGPPLRRADPPAVALLDGLAARGGPAGLPRPAAGQRAHPATRPARPADHHGRDRPAPPDPAVRRADAAGLVRPARPRAFRAARRGCAVAGHLHQPPGPLDRAGGGRGTGGGGLAGHRAQPAAVLRPDLDLHRAAGHGPASAAAYRGRAGPVPAARRQGGRAGAELHGGVPVRRTRADAREPRRPAPAAADRHAGRAAAGSHRRLAAAVRRR